VKAISIAEKGLESAQTKLVGNSKQAVMVNTLKNSVAYYYAEAALPEKEELARRYAEDAYRYRVDSKGPIDRIAGALATRGYVKITFGHSTDEISDGIKDCEDARRDGAREDLYFRHLARAQQRLTTS